MDNEFHKSVSDAQIALAYASEKGLLTDDDEKGITEIVTMVKHNIAAISPDMEVKFWTAYSKLTKKIKPASVESILAIEDVPERRGGWGFLFPNLSDARRSIRFYQRFGFIFLVVMLIFQVYWIVGTGFMADIIALPGARDKLYTEKRAREEILGDKAAMDVQIQLLEAEMINIETKLGSSTGGLLKWYTPLRILTFDKGSMEDEYYSNRVIRYASFVLEVIQFYVLPILYGLLGAFAYILRRLSREVSEKSFSRESKVNYILRLHLGALGGLAVGWFFGDNSNAPVNISSLSPLALAFLAGYSVDLFFTSMDKIIDSISSSTKSSNSDQPKATSSSASK